MRTSLPKLEIVLLCTIFLTTYASAITRSVQVTDVNGCALKYQKGIVDVPDIFLTTTVTPGVCRLQRHQHNSTENYETMRIEYYENEYEQENEDLRGKLKTMKQEYVKNYKGLNYDVHNKSLLYIVRAVLKPNEETLVQRRFNDSRIIKEFTLRNRFSNKTLKRTEIDDFVYDWRTKNIFVKSKEGIAVMNLNKPWKPVDIILESSMIRSFTIHPNAGYLFFVVFARTDNDVKNVTSSDELKKPYERNFTSKIYRTYLDGSNKRQIGTIITRRDDVIDNLVIDYHTDKLYWSIANVIQSSNLDGTDVKNMINRELFHGLNDDATRSISFDKKYIYYILKNKTVHRFHKEKLKEDKDFEIVNEGQGLISEIMVYDPEAHKITTDHPCLINNGGCEQYCLAWPKDLSKRQLSRTCRSANA